MWGRREEEQEVGEEWIQKEEEWKGRGRRARRCLPNEVGLSHLAFSLRRARVVNAPLFSGPWCSFALQPELLPLGFLETFATYFDIEHYKIITDTAKLFRFLICMDPSTI